MQGKVAKRNRRTKTKSVVTEDSDLEDESPSVEAQAGDEKTDDATKTDIAVNAKKASC